MRTRKDYVVSSLGDEFIFCTLSEARRKAKCLSKLNEESTINKWVYDIYCDDMILDESFEIQYSNGKPQKEK